MLTALYFHGVYPGKKMSDRYRLIEADFSSEFMSLINEAARDGWRVVSMTQPSDKTSTYKFAAILERLAVDGGSDVRFMDVPPPGLA